jgi:hypothetical protein
MAFTSTILGQSALANRRVTYGTYDTSSTETGGDIDTGLMTCECIMLTPKGSAVTSNQAVVNETLPVAGNAVTIVHDASSDGYWVAIGY